MIQLIQQRLSIYLGNFKISVVVHFTRLDFRFQDIDCHQMGQPRFRVDLFKEKDLDLGWVFPHQMERHQSRKIPHSCITVHIKLTS